MKLIAAAIALALWRWFRPALGPRSRARRTRTPIAPNMYNRAAQPLSPYLNLLRGGNTAVNYFYGVRPGTQPGAFTGMFTQPTAGPRQTFFPVVDTLADLLEDPRDAGTVCADRSPGWVQQHAQLLRADVRTEFSRGRSSKGAGWAASIANGGSARRSAA